MDAEEHYYEPRVDLPPFREERKGGGGEEEVGGQIEEKRQGEQLYIYPAG